ncbi:MAG: toll/interleukin-1 receptor domain-containing protein [Mycobacteriales bacterium]
MTNEPGIGGNSAPRGAQAVFLSYASEDAPGAQKICAALRSAGIDVWFDQSELRGGDAWDQKIRREIRTCALFVPIISGSTQARTEGYFRLEWHLADQRTVPATDPDPHAGCETGGVLARRAVAVGAARRSRA